MFQDSTAGVRTCFAVCTATPTNTAAPSTTRLTEGSNSRRRTRRSSEPKFARFNQRDDLIETTIIPFFAVDKLCIFNIYDIYAKFIETGKISNGQLFWNRCGISSVAATRDAISGSSKGTLLIFWWNTLFYLNMIIITCYFWILCHVLQNESSTDHAN